MGLNVSARKDTRMNRRVKGFYPPVKTFGKARNRRNIGNGDFISCKYLDVPPVERISHPETGQKRGQFKDAVFIKYADKCSLFNFSLPNPVKKELAA